MTKQLAQLYSWDVSIVKLYLFFEDAISKNYYCSIAQNNITVSGFNKVVHLGIDAFMCFYVLLGICDADKSSGKQLCCHETNLKFSQDTHIKVLTIYCSNIVLCCDSAHVMLWHKSEQAQHRLSLI